MNRSLLPEFLRGYDPFTILEGWAAQKAMQKRHWSISLWEGRKVRCRLTWVFGDSQIGSIEKAAMTPEEAVYLSIKEFVKTEAA